MHDVLELFGTGERDDETHQRRETHVRRGKKEEWWKNERHTCGFCSACVDDGFVFHRVGASTHNKVGKK